ncbi:mycothiol synthase [Leucobacter allii]|uniref:mycothiol synthase n=1 Tax=Leucobacter allii TaxID=2932247 RepID=UPI001FD35138|nr:mycothiol synthase [Leucobacter allii]UOR00811.1 mycothiol synthase [Leucobacter allii]
MTLEAAEATSAAEIETARALVAEAEAHDGASAISDQALLAAAQGQRALLLFSEGGSPRPVAVGVVGDGEIDLVVRPEERGRGIGAAASRALLAAADDGVPLLAWAHGENPGAEALLRASGFAPVRSLYRMALDPALLPVDGRDPFGLPVPEGLALRAFDPASPRDAGAWVRANAAAFADHPEQGRITEADFAILRREPWFDPEDLLLLAAGGTGDAAEDGAGELAGSSWIKTVRGENGDAETELYAVGVRPEYAGRGLGRLLLDATLARMAQHAPERVTLYVDGENAAAVRMYETAGFTIDSRSRQWRREPRAGVDVRMDA